MYVCIWSLGLERIGRTIGLCKPGESGKITSYLIHRPIIKHPLSLQLCLYIYIYHISNYISSKLYVLIFTAVSIISDAVFTKSPIYNMFIIIGIMHNATLIIQ